MSSSPLVVRLKPRRALPFFSQHPWVFAGAIGAVNGMPQLGDPVILQSHEGEFIAHGLFNPVSNIRVRLYSWDENQPLDDDFWRRRVEAAIRGRRRLFPQMNAQTACRLVYSESDGLSGLTVDRFGEWLSLQWTSAALQQRADVILTALQEFAAPRGVWLRTERGIKELEGLSIDDGLLAGETPPPLEVEEHGVRYHLDLPSGQKTGFYCDQRDNRLAVAHSARPGRLLDGCCYTGGFGLTALVRGAATEVVAVDSSATALELAQHNAELNGCSDRFVTHCSDVFDFLEDQLAAGERYDTIVLDPPKLARTRGGLERALKAYARLNRLALSLLNPEGLLATCSCSGHVTREDFEQVLGRASLDAERNVQILEQRGQAADHPVSVHCLETSYLKCFLCRVL